MHRQLKRHQPSSKEAADICRTRLAGIAEEYFVTPNNREGFSLQQEHFYTIRPLKKNDDLVITHLDKGKGVVILKRKDYIEKMLDILSHTSKFKRVGPSAQFDGMARIERSLQNMLR